MVLDLLPLPKTFHPAALTWFPHPGFLLQNKIQRIENLACITSLRYVAPRQGRRKEWVVGGEKLAWGSLTLALLLLPYKALSPHLSASCLHREPSTWCPPPFPSSSSSSL